MFKKTKIMDQLPQEASTENIVVPDKNKPKFGKKRTLILSSLALIIIAGGVAAYFLFFNKTKENQPTYEGTRTPAVSIEEQGPEVLEKLKSQGVPVPTKEPEVNPGAVKQKNEQ